MSFIVVTIISRSPLPLAGVVEADDFAPTHQRSVRGVKLEALPPSGRTAKLELARRDGEAERLDHLDQARGERVAGTNHADLRGRVPDCRLSATRQRNEKDVAGPAHLPRLDLV